MSWHVMKCHVMAMAMLWRCYVAVMWLLCYVSFMFLHPHFVQMLESCRAHEAHIRYNHITSSVVSNLQSHSYRVMAWYGGNVDDSEEELLTCIEAGVTKLCTNRPDRLAWLCGWVPKSAVQPAQQLHQQAPS